LSSPQFGWGKKVLDRVRLRGDETVLDAGCGTGEHVLLAAAHGAAAMGVDLSAVAIEKARAKAAERGLAARFEVADALRLDRLGEIFGTVLDSGLFHVFDDTDRASYVLSLAAVLEPGGTYYMMCFSDSQPGAWGPRRVRREEIEQAFADGWEIVSLTPDAFAINPVEGATEALAWLAVIRRR
jgi:cyclopropane fatty-acyl-phospholipid synthase-like methyltransferase